MAQPKPIAMKSDLVNVNQCSATLTHNDNITLRYIEQHKPLIKEHISMYHELRLFVDDILSKQIQWKLSKLPQKLLQIVDHNDKHHDEIHATPDLYLYLQKYATSQTLIACCMGANYTISVAKQSILDIVQWRVCSKIDTITPQIFKNSLQTKTVFNINEFDKNGHPICHFKVAETPADDAWKTVRSAVYNIEKCIKLAAKHDRYQILWMIDLEYLSYSTIPPMEVLREISNLMTYYYPERLYKSYLLFTPWLFSAIFAMIQAVLPTRTQQKLMNPSWYESSAYDTFKGDIDKRQLMKRFGGDNKAQYEYEYELNEYKKLKQIQICTEDEKESVSLEEVKELSDDEDDSKLCIVCLDGKRDHVLIPCGHICVCSECKDAYNNNEDCPLCRTKVEMVLKVYG